MRPLLEEATQGTSDEEIADGFDHPTVVQPNRTKREADDDARAFALDLIRRWVRDPSNVRLLRIGLDLFPDAAVLQSILDLLRPYTIGRDRGGPAKRIAWYCLAELMRAGATETGFGDDADLLPAGLDVHEYRRVLCVEAVRLLSLPPRSVPWYVRQQAYLFLAVFGADQAPVKTIGRDSDTRHYRALVLFLQAKAANLDADWFSTVAIVARRGLSKPDSARALVQKGLTRSRLQGIAARDPSFASELIENDGRFLSELPTYWRNSLLVQRGGHGERYRSLANVVLNSGPTCALRNELSLLLFADQFLRQIAHAKLGIPIAVPPATRHGQNASGGVYRD